MPNFVALNSALCLRGELLTFRHFLTVAMAGFFTLSSLPARPSVVGVVDAAVRVHLNTAAVTAGTTVYDGDRFSTASGGMLRARIGTAILELAEASVSVRGIG